MLCDVGFGFNSEFEGALGSLEKKELCNKLSIVSVHFLWAVTLLEIIHKQAFITKLSKFSYGPHLGMFCMKTILYYYMTSNLHS